MSLYDLQDKEFDALFKKAADSTEYPFSELAWQGMERRLDRWDRYIPLFWKLLGGSIILLLGILSYLIYLSPSEFNYVSGKTLPPQIENEITGNGINPVKSNTDKTDAGQKEQVNITDEEFEIATDQNELLHDAKATMDMDQTKQESFVYQRKDVQRTALNAGDEFTLQEEGFSIKKIDGLQIPDMASINNGLLSVSRKSAPEEIIVPEKSTSIRGYSLNFIIGPDFSGVSSNEYGTGTYIGLGFELYFLKNLSVFAGVSYSRKKYEVYDEYSLPYPGIWTYGQVPDQVNIACHVLDIPINLYYSIINDNKNRVFIGAGLSSYLMLTEEYSFKYDHSYNPDLIKEYNIKNENQHYFGIVNLSAGYTRYVNNRWAWQIEPYYKLPIQDIAAAKVRLKSFGALISLKYRFR